MIRADKSIITNIIFRVHFMENDDFFSTVTRMMTLKLFAGILCITVVLLTALPGISLAGDAMLSVFRIEIDMTSSGKNKKSGPIRDFYINGGKNHGLVSSMVLDIYRKKILRDESLAKDFEVTIPVGQMKVIRVFKEVAVARIIALASPEDSPVLEYRSVKIGDYAVPRRSRDTSGAGKVAKGVKQKTDAQGTGLIFSSKLLFGLDEWRLRAEAKAALTAVHDMFNRLKNKNILVVGHTCSLGREKHNLELSRKRAQTVSDYLVKTGGIPKNRIRIEYYGSRFPIVSNATEEGRMKNRRVDIRFLSAT